jgi:hypothetical protein
MAHVTASLPTADIGDQLSMTLAELHYLVVVFETGI